AALLLRHSLQLEAEAIAVEAAVDRVLSHGPHSRDIGGHAGTQEVLDAVLLALDDYACTSCSFLRFARAAG
ncbi:MAG: isocitrate/isopropylmalate family dehydrogenase, partial [Rhodanobacter sp.]